MSIRKIKKAQQRDDAKRARIKRENELEMFGLACPYSDDSEDREDTFYGPPAWTADALPVTKEIFKQARKKT